jgi:hypothetical protein
MTRASVQTGFPYTCNGYPERLMPGSLADVHDVIVDRGLVIDIYVRVSLLGSSC